MTKDIQINENPTQELIRFSIEKGADLDKLEKLLTIKERYDAMEARKAYHEAMSAFKENPPKIDKDKSVSFGAGKTSYKHASLYNVTQKVGAALSKQGLSASWTTKQNGVIMVTCRITHVNGHSEETTLSAPSDVSGSKNAIQAIGSTITYLERYTLLGLCGLATFDSDDDGNAVGTIYIDDKELSQILDMVADKEVNVTKFCEHLKIESLEKMPKEKYQQAITAIQAKKKVSN